MELRKLNDLGYPTIVIGTLDLHRKSHLGNIYWDKLNRDNKQRENFC